MEFFQFSKGNPNLITAPHCSYKIKDNGLEKGSADRGTDIIAEYMAEKLGFSIQTAVFSRFTLDFNSNRDNAIPTKFNNHNIPVVSEEEKNFRLKRYDKYYENIKSIIKKGSLHIALHSMFPTGPKGSIDEGISRPDFRLGTLNGATIDDKKAAFLMKYLKENGYYPRLNDVFVGKEEIKKTREYGAESIQIEINAKYLLNPNLKEIDQQAVMIIAELLANGISALINSDSFPFNHSP